MYTLVIMLYLSILLQLVLEFIFSCITSHLIGNRHAKKRQYKVESVNRSQMDLKHKTCDIRAWKKHLFLDISSTNINTLIPSLDQCVETRSIEVCWFMSATSGSGRASSATFERHWENLSTYLWTALPLLFQFHDHFADGRTPWTSDQLIAKPLPKHRTRQTQNKHSHQTSMPCVGFEPTIPASERAKTVHALERSTTVTGLMKALSPSCSWTNWGKPRKKSR
jgi:hypothetical protein